jgi:DNA-binding HxlR family transcriptional regulator
METMTTAATQPARATQAEAFCPIFHRAVELIGRRWTGAIVHALLSGVTHFSKLSAAIPELSDRMLAARLEELQREGIVERRVIPSTPVRVEYHLTEKGRALAPIIHAVSDWAYQWGEPREQPAPRCTDEGCDEPAG